MRPMSTGPRSAICTRTLKRSRTGARIYLRVRIDMELRLKRDKDVSIVKMQYGTIETLDGEVLRLDTQDADWRIQRASDARRRDQGRDDPEAGRQWRAPGT